MSSTETQFIAGNPGGHGSRRRKPRPVSDALVDRLALPAGENPPPETVADEIAMSLISLGRRRNLPAIQTILNRVEGRAPITVAVEHEHGIDDDLRNILVALGVPVTGTETGAQAVAGDLEPGGAGGGALPGDVEACEAPEAPERALTPVHGSDRAEGEPATLYFDAAAARKV